MEPVITVITYHKRKGEYVIHRREFDSGRSSVTYANQLTGEEELFCKVSEKFNARFDGLRITQWG